MNMYAVVKFWDSFLMLCKCRKGPGFGKILIKEIIQTEEIGSAPPPVFEYNAEESCYYWTSSSVSHEIFPLVAHKNVTAIAIQSFDSDDDAKLWFEMEYNL